MTEEKEYSPATMYVFLAKKIRLLSIGVTG